MHLKTMVRLDVGLGRMVDDVVGTADPVGVADGRGVAHPASRRTSSVAASVFIVQ